SVEESELPLRVVGVRPCRRHNSSLLSAIFSLNCDPSKLINIRPDAQPRQTAPPCRSPASSPCSESDPHTAASSADRLLPLLSSAPRVASRCPPVALPGNPASPIPVPHFAGCVPATLPGVGPGAACPPHQTGRSPRLSECCNVPGLLESDSSAAFVAAPRT